MVHLSSKIILNNVLFAPSLNCNLISIAQLIDDNIYEVTFTKILGVIQDLTSRSPTRVSEPKREAYYLIKPVAKKDQANKAISYDTWHS